ncbi:type IV pilin N-terminal domain-containing protein [uncultured Methanospirillum sp.]|uniref:type IV pilin N-terminal domain-containing protein n=1 Tax=uncultured Methanospirillum sp. TaxID=262503 RepID=UPI0029C7E7AE|nr:type IV pilin N-terminal domain-containing protein [uncultured Methanospirillum sp.]
MDLPPSCLIRGSSGSFHQKGRVPPIKTEPAVSPVVGIMLMLTVTLILAAIISGFTGGIAKSQSKPPQLLFEASMVHDVIIKSNSFLDIWIISVSEGIPTKDLKLQTEWRNQSNQVNRCTITPNSGNVGSDTYPRGFGSGVTDKATGSSNFGNFTLLAGTRLNVNATVSGAMNAVLSPYWEEITDGTPIRIQLVHVPSGSIIADKEITAET